MIAIAPEPPGAAQQIEVLLDRAFGRDRRAKTAERLREGRLPADGLSFVALDDGEVVGSVRFWHVQIDGRLPALLLGPLAVAPQHRGRRLGTALVRRGLRAARALGHAAVILVGDAPYYRRFGFTAELTRRLSLPGPVDRRRLLALELRPGALAGAAGCVRAAGVVAASGRRIVSRDTGERDAAAA